MKKIIALVPVLFMLFGLSTVYADGLKVGVVDLPKLMQQSPQYKTINDKLKKICDGIKLFISKIILAIYFKDPANWQCYTSFDIAIQVDIRHRALLSQCFSDGAFTRTHIST